MSEEFNENLEVTEEPVKKQEEIEEAVQMQEEKQVEEYIPETVQEEPVIEVEAEVQPEAVLEQAQDGSWRHAEDSPFSPFYVPDRKQKNNNKLTIGLIILLLLLLVAGLIFAVSKLVEAAVGEAAVAWNESAGAIEDFLDDIRESINEKKAEELLPDAEDEKDNSDESDIQDFQDFLLPENPELPDSYEEYMEDFLDRYSEDEYGYDDYDEYDDSEDESYVPSPDDEYYVKLADAIRDDLSYSVEFADYNHSDFDKSVYISVLYAQVSEDLANSDTINECLKDGAMYYAYMYESDTISDFMLDVQSYVTYMDEKTLSVVVSEYIYADGEGAYDLYCMNFDLKTGTLLNNTDMIEVSDELVQVFIERSICQNGYTSSVSDYTNEKIEGFMSDEDSLILFYTPVGLEIGYNHPDGWVTATLKDYQRFMKKL